MHRFEDLKIWQKAMDVTENCYRTSENFRKEEKYGLTSQLRQSAVSIPSNIAEGCSRNSEIEFKRFLEIAMGSLFEVHTQLTIIEELNFIKTEDLKSIFELLETEGKMINGLINTIKKS